MPKVIIYCQPESNRVAVCNPVQSINLSIDQIAKKDVPRGCPYTICNSSELPTDDTFFDAWIYDQSVGNVPINVDVPEVHSIWKNKWRAAREPILKILDVEWMRALEQGNTALTQELASKKQALRDVTLITLPSKVQGESVDSFTMRIKEIWPECLNW
jgi:hypothetical protein